MATPKVNEEYIFYMSVVDSADGGAFRANPTIAAGDFQVSTEGGAFGNLATLPVVTPAGGIAIRVTVSQSEMNASSTGKIVVQAIDAAGGEWDDVMIFIDADVVNINNLTRSATPANALTINATGQAESDMTSIHGTALTETAGQLAGAFIKFFDVAAPTATARGKLRTPRPPRTARLVPAQFRGSPRRG